MMEATLLVMSGAAVITGTLLALRNSQNREITSRNSI